MTRLVLVLAALGLLATLAPPAQATQFVCSPLTVSNVVQCGVTIVVGVVTSANNTVQCVLNVPPGSYPDGLDACVAIIPAFGSTPLLP